jgi:hypothetical protein
MTWKEKAHSVIAECYRAYYDHTHLMPSPSMPEKNKKELMLMIRKSYPFGQRAMHPYKVWCKEVAAVREFLYPTKNEPVNEGLFAVSSTKTEGEE